MFALTTAVAVATASPAFAVRKLSVPVPARGSLTIVELKLKTKPAKKQKKIPLAWLKAKKGSGANILAGVDRTKTKGVFSAVILVGPGRGGATAGASAGGNAPLVTLETTGVQTNITARQIVELPMGGRNFADLTGVLDGEPPPEDLVGVEEALIESMVLVSDPVTGVIDVVNRIGMSDWADAPACWGGLEPFGPVGDLRRVDVAAGCTRTMPGQIGSMVFQLPMQFHVTRPLGDPAGARFYDVQGSSIGWSFPSPGAPLGTRLSASYEIAPAAAITEGTFGIEFRTAPGLRAETFDLQIGRLAR